MSLTERLRQIEHRITQIEGAQQSIAALDAKVSDLLAALAEEEADDEAEPTRTLDGDVAGAERDQTQSLG